jgi:hypothetical protein
MTKPELTGRTEIKRKLFLITKKEISLIQYGSDKYFSRNSAKIDLTINFDNF